MKGDVGIIEGKRLDPAQLNTLTDRFARSLLDLTGFVAYDGNGRSACVTTQCRENNQIALRVQTATKMTRTTTQRFWATLEVDVSTEIDLDEYARIRESCMQAAEMLGLPILLHLNQDVELDDVLNGT